MPYLNGIRGCSVPIGGFCLRPFATLICIAGITGWPLGLPSLMIGAIAVGVAVDDTLHLVTQLTRRRSMVKSLYACWSPCLGSSLVAAACMAAFAFCPL